MGKKLDENYKNELMYVDMLKIDTPVQITFFLFLNMCCCLSNSFLSEDEYKSVNSDIFFSENVLLYFGSRSGNKKIQEVIHNMATYNTDEHGNHYLTINYYDLFKFAEKIYMEISEKHGKFYILCNYEKRRVLFSFEKNIIDELLRLDKGVTNKINVDPVQTNKLITFLKLIKLKSSHVPRNQIIISRFDKFLTAYSRYMFNNDPEYRKRVFAIFDENKIKGEVISFIEKNTKF